MNSVTDPTSRNYTPDAFIQVLFRYGLAFFKSVEEEILQLKDYMSIFTFMRVMSHRMHDTRLVFPFALDLWCLTNATCRNENEIDMTSCLFAKDVL